MDRDFLRKNRYKLGKAFSNSKRLKELFLELGLDDLAEETDDMLNCLSNIFDSIGFTRPETAGEQRAKKDWLLILDAYEYFGSQKDAKGNRYISRKQLRTYLKECKGWDSKDISNAFRDTPGRMINRLLNNGYIFKLYAGWVLKK